jgi:hypothetical protein
VDKIRLDVIQGTSYALRGLRENNIERTENQSKKHNTPRTSINDSFTLPGTARRE